MAATRPTPDFDDELLSAYVDNELTPQERAGVEERLRSDARAQQVVAELRRTSEAVKSLPRVPLGRDLSASVLAAIERRAPAADSPTVLTLSDRRADHAAGRKRALVWTALAVAAALMLMAWRPGAEVRDERQVAQTSPPSGAQQAKDKLRSGGTLERQESVSATGRTAASGGNAASEAARPAASPNLSAAQPNRAAQRPAEARSRGDSVTVAPAASRAMSRGGTGTLPSHDADELPAADAGAAAAPAEGRADEAERESTPQGGLAPSSELRTIEVVVPADAGVAAFEGMLAEHQITMSAEELPAEQAAAWGASRGLMSADAEQSGADATRAETDSAAAGANQPSASDAILVEASPAVIAVLVASLQPQADGKFALPPATEAKAATAAVGGAALESNPADQLRDNAADRSANRAWRLRLGDKFAPGATLLGSAEPAASPSAGGRGGRAGGEFGFGGGGGGLGGAAGPEPRVRVLFLLRPAPQ